MTDSPRLGWRAAALEEVGLYRRAAREASAALHLQLEGQGQARTLDRCAKFL